MLATILTSQVTHLVSEICLSSFQKLSRKYSVDVQSVLSQEIETNFHQCLEVAIQAFLKLVSQNKDITLRQQELIVEYLKSEVVTEQISHLIALSSEVFERDLLTQNAKVTLLEVFGESTETIIFDAWEQFLQAFVFASMSTPELANFLQASYETDSFQDLSNIDDILETFNSVVDNFKNEELTITHAINQYTQDLKTYQRWAANFS